MKFKSLLQLVFVLAVGQFLFSCNTAEYYRFAATTPEQYQNKKVKSTEQEAPAAVSIAEEMVSTTPEATAATSSEPVLEATTTAQKPVLFEKQRLATSPVSANVITNEAPSKALSVTEVSVLAAAQERLASMTKAEKKAFKMEAKHTLRNAQKTTNILLVVLAILIPPLAVALYEGITKRFWISLLLTLLFFIPGVIYSLLVVTDSI